jgi:protein-S-isoprenylcysteine O-methyltransferase Ste14
MVIDKPVFEVGIWNAWILTLFVIIHPLITQLIDKAVGTGGFNQKMGDIPAEKEQIQSLPLPSVLLFILFLISIFIPLRLGIVWFYVGLSIYSIGIVIFIGSIISAARTPVGQLFTQGMYRYSRHPMYLSFLLIFFGISLASLSWLFLVLSMLWMVFPLSQVNAEERGCLEAFGEKYRAYMDKTPKWLGLPKSN